jgi:hypothetical protein
LRISQIAGRNLRFSVGSARFSESEAKEFASRRISWTSGAEVYPETSRSIRQFKGVVKLRDWLAHWRYWHPKIGRPSYDVGDVFDIASRMLNQRKDTD